MKCWIERYQLYIPKAIPLSFKHAHKHFVQGQVACSASISICSASQPLCTFALFAMLQLLSGREWKQGTLPCSLPPKSAVCFYFVVLQPVPLSYPLVLHKQINNYKEINSATSKRQLPVGCENKVWKNTFQSALTAKFLYFSPVLYFDKEDENSLFTLYSISRI